MSKRQTNALVLHVYKFEDLPNALASLGELQRKKEAIVLEYDSKISTLQNELAEKTESLDYEIKRIAQSIKYFMDENRSFYISDDKKTLKLETGEISYRKGKASVKTRSSEKLINEILEKNSLTKARDSFLKKLTKVYIRMKLELNKEAILENPLDAVAITNVEIEEGVERFYIKPYSTESELEVA